MNKKNFGGYASINSFVKAKLKKFNSLEKNFSSLYEMMFSEGDNIIYEKSSGYRIIKTTYAESKNRIEKQASALYNILGPSARGGIVGLYMNNGLEWIEAFWTILRAGFCPLLLNLRLGKDTIEKTVRDLGVKAVISDGEQFSCLTLGVNDLSVTDGKLADIPFGDEIFLMSSGTSSKIKVCAYSAEEFSCQVNESYRIILECRQMKKHYKGELKQLDFLPFYHIFGLVAVYIWFAFFSRTFVHLPDLAPSTIVNTIRRHKVTHIFAVPLFWNKVYSEAISTIRDKGEKTAAKFEKGLRIYRKLRKLPFLCRAFSIIAFREVRDNLFGDSIKFLISGGSEVKPEVIEFFNAIGYHMANGYGMTEIGITSVELSRSPAILDSRSVGKPLSSVEYKIGENSELLVRSKGLAKYIISGGEKTENNGWFNTHDIASEIKGRYFILGRRDDLVVSRSGENLNPNLIEPEFRQIDGINEICLIGPKCDGDIIPTLIVSVDKYCGKNSLIRIKKEIGDKLSCLRLDGMITKIIFTSSELIDGNEIKLNRRLITEKYKSGLLTTVESEKMDSKALDDALRNKISELMAKALNTDSTKIDDGFDFFSDGGGTSLDYFTLVSLVSDEFGFRLPVSDGETLRTVKELHDYIETKLDK